MKAPAVASLPVTGLARRIAPFWLVISAVLLFMNRALVSNGLQADPDDTLRLVQVRDLLGGQGWFDLHQYRINPPDGIVMHWSRLVDIPLAAVESLLRPMLGAALAEQTAAAIVPLLTLLALLLLLGKLTRRLFDDGLIGYVCVLVGTSFALTTQIMPTRVDHHGWQIVAAVAALLGLTDGHARRGGAIIGAALALGMAISLEILPIAAAYAAVLGLAWLIEPHRHERFVAFIVTLAGLSVTAFVLTRGFDLSVYCDAVSPGYLAALMVAAAGSVATMMIARGSRGGIVIGLGASGIAAAGVLAVVAPACLHGPFPMLDPLLRAVWYENVLEGRPIWTIDRPSLAQWILPSLFGLCAAVRQWHIAATQERRKLWLGLVLLQAATFVLGVLVMRSMTFAIAYSAVPLAGLLRDLVNRLELAPPLGKMALAVLLMLAVMPAMPVYFAERLLGIAPSTKPKLGIDAKVNGRFGDFGDDPVRELSRIAGLPQGTIFAPLDIGPSLLLHTPHSVVATGHHRGAVPMHDVITAFIVDPPVARTIIARHHARYVVMLPHSEEIGAYRALGPSGLAAQLAKGETPEWLTPVPLPPGSVLRAYAVKPN